MVAAMKALLLFLSVFALSISSAHAGIGFAKGTFYRNLSADQIKNATRGGSVTGPVAEMGGGTFLMATLQMVCADPSAETLESCDTFIFATTGIDGNGTLYLRAPTTGQVYTKEDLSSWKNFKNQLRNFNRGLHRIDADETAAFMFPNNLICGKSGTFWNGAICGLFFGIPTSFLLFETTLPVGLVVGVVDSLVTRHEVNRFMKSIVSNDQSVSFQFGWDKFEELGFK